MGKTKETETEEVKAIRPGDLADELEVDAKRIRAFLRTEFTRSSEEKNSSWLLTPAQAEAVRARFNPAEDVEEDEDDE